MVSCTLNAHYRSRTSPFSIAVTIVIMIRSSTYGQDVDQIDIFNFFAHLPNQSANLEIAGSMAWSSASIASSYEKDLNWASITWARWERTYPSLSFLFGLQSSHLVDIVQTLRKACTCHPTEFHVFLYPSLVVRYVYLLWTFFQFRDYGIFHFKTVYCFAHCGIPPIFGESRLLLQHIERLRPRYASIVSRAVSERVVLHRQILYQDEDDFAGV